MLTLYYANNTLRFVKAQTKNFRVLLNYHHQSHSGVCNSATVAFIQGMIVMFRNRSAQEKNKSFMSIVKWAQWQTSAEPFPRRTCFRTTVWFTWPNWHCNQQINLLHFPSGSGEVKGQRISDGLCHNSWLSTHKCTIQKEHVPLENRAPYIEMTNNSDQIDENITSEAVHSWWSHLQTVNRKRFAHFTFRLVSV